MAQELLDIPHIRPGPQQVNGNAVAQQVRVQVLGLRSAPPVQVDEEPVDGGRGRPPSELAEDQRAP
jgi:hypothetical protein